MNSVHSKQCSASALPGVVSLLCAGYIKAEDSLGRSNLTELQREHSQQPTEEKSIRKKEENSIEKKNIMVMC